MDDIILIGPNLYFKGNLGDFETDRSGWLISDGDAIWTRSSSFKFNGVFSARILQNVVQENQQNVGFSTFFGQIGKDYVVRLKLRTDAVNPICSSGATVRATVTVGAQNHEYIEEATISASNSGWVSLETRFNVTSLLFGTVPLSLEFSEDILAGGLVYVDEIRVFEYEAAPPPSCMINIHEGDTVVTDVSVNGGFDGSIQGSANGNNGAVEWRLNGGSWQSSSLFTGLSAGFYVLDVRETGNTDCFDIFSITIDEPGDAGGGGNPGLTWDIVTEVVNETVRGANDGRITISFTGDRNTPERFSINDGANFQTSNIFSGLAPGTYPIEVRDVYNNVQRMQATVLEGSLVFTGIFFSDNPIPYALRETGNASEENYRIYNEVHVESNFDSNVFTRQLAVQLEPDANGGALFYLQQAFRGSFNPMPPSYRESEIRVLTDRSIRYKNFYGDVFNDLIEPSSLSESGLFLAVYGGLSKRAYPDVDYFGDVLPNQKKFMSWKSTSRRVDREQEDYLQFFLYATGISSIRLKADVTFTDDSTTSTPILKRLDGVGRGDLILVPAGPIHSGINSIDASKIVKSYVLTLTDQSSNAISEPISYELISHKPPRTRYFMFLNSVGAYEIFRATGVFEESFVSDKEEIQKFLGHDYDALDGEFEAYNMSSRKQFSGSTGFLLDAEEARVLSDLFLSPRVYALEGAKRVPIVVSGRETRIRVDKEYQYYVRFGYSEGYVERRFTPTSINN